MSDKRYILARERFETCTNEEIQRVLDNIDKICWDTHNFDPETSTFCPIAIAMNLHNTVKNPTDQLVKEEIAKRFNPTNIFKGTPGTFYTSNRKEDTINLCNEILNNRKL